MKQVLHDLIDLLPESLYHNVYNILHGLTTLFGTKPTTPPAPPTTPVTEDGPGPIPPTQGPGGGD